MLSACLALVESRALAESLALAESRSIIQIDYSFSCHAERLSRFSGQSKHKEN